MYNSNPFKILFLSIYLIISTGLMAEKIVSKNNDNSYFILEKVDNDNINQWYGFIKKARLAQNGWIRKLTFIEGVIPLDAVDEDLIPLQKPIDKIVDKQVKELIKDKEAPLTILKRKYLVMRDVGDGINNFENALGNSKLKLGDVWVAYISFLDPSQEVSENDKDANVEIAMTVLVKENSPLSMHMGIFRNPSYLMSNEPQHARISPEFHSFAARASLEKYPNLLYMVTTPLSSMSNIFKEVLSIDSYAEGMNKKGTWIVRDKGQVVPNEDTFKFALYDRDIYDEQKRLILLIDNHNKNEYWWLVSRLHGSLDLHPYFVVRLDNLANLFRGDLYNL